MILSSQSSLICGWTEKHLLWDFVKDMRTNKQCKCFYSHIHVSEMGLGANCNTLARNSRGGGTRKDLHELARPVLSIHCRTESEYGFCLEIAARPQPSTHIKRERKWQIPQRTAISSAASLHVITIKFNHSHLIGRHPPQIQTLEAVSCILRFIVPSAVVWFCFPFLIAASLCIHTCAEKSWCCCSEGFWDV